MSSDTARVSTSTDVSKEPAIPVTQEVDVVVLPSLLESDITEQTKETSQESTPKKSGITAEFSHLKNLKYVLWLKGF